jgi:hypothetical protein
VHHLTGVSKGVPFILLVIDLELIIIGFLPYEVFRIPDFKKNRLISYKVGQISKKKEDISLAHGKIEPI